MSRIRDEMTKTDTVTFTKFMHMTDEVWKVDLSSSSTDPESYSNYVLPPSRSSVVQTAHDVISMHKKIHVAKLIGYYECDTEKLTEKLIILKSNQDSKNNLNLNEESETSMEKTMRIIDILQRNELDLENLRMVIWSDPPLDQIYPCWYLLLSDSQSTNNEHNFANNRINYAEMKSKAFDLIQPKTLKEINNDLKRMKNFNIFSLPLAVQESLKNILVVWTTSNKSKTHYFQGMNDILMVVYMVVIAAWPTAQTCAASQLSFFFDLSGMSDEDFERTEANTYETFSNIIARFQKFYQPDMKFAKESMNKIMSIVRLADNLLYQHILKLNIDPLSFMFRWFNNLMTREICIEGVPILWNKYFSYREPECLKFHNYICAAFLLSFSRQLQAERSFQDLLLKLQNLPTSNWDASHLNKLTYLASTLVKTLQI